MSVLTPRDKAMMCASLDCIADMIVADPSMRRDDIVAVLRVSSAMVMRQAMWESSDIDVTESSIDDFRAALDAWNRQHAPGRKDPPL